MWPVNIGVSARANTPYVSEVRVSFIDCSSKCPDMLS